MFPQRHRTPATPSPKEEWATNIKGTTCVIVKIRKFIASHLHHCLHPIPLICLHGP